VVEVPDPGFFVPARPDAEIPAFRGEDPQRPVVVVQLAGDDLARRLPGAWSLALKWVSDSGSARKRACYKMPLASRGRCGGEDRVECHACGHPYARETELLVRCGHGFREFDGDPIAYHADLYRKQIQRVDNEMDAEGRPTAAFHKARKKIVKGRVAMIRKLLSRDDECLDVGAGAGTFAREVERRISSIECTELDDRLADECERLGFTTHRGDFMSLEFDRSFDIVFAWHVVEHVIDTRAFVSKAQSLARKYLILEVPVDRRCPKDFDGHYHYFSETSLRLVCGEPTVVSVKDGVQPPALQVVTRGTASR
jgi:hypothetical protein